MKYGICNLSIVPLRSESSDLSELVSQILYGEVFKILENRKFWSRIRLAYDGTEGWIDNRQHLEIDEHVFTEIANSTPILSKDLVEFVEDERQRLITIPLGSSLNGLKFLNHYFEGLRTEQQLSKRSIITTAFNYINCPFLWGGKTPFGIDASGFTQMVYKLNGYKLLRTPEQQCSQGDALSFIEESEPGDLAFFDDNDGNIIHVGIIMEDHYIIHVNGMVRIDRIDHSGIYNIDQKSHTHKLRVIKKII